MSIENKIHFFEEFFWFKDVRWEIRFRSIRVFISGIIAVLLIAIPLTVDGMSGRPSVNPEQLENGDYLQKSSIDNRKILIKDKDDNVKGYLQRSYLDQRKMLIYDKNGNVKGYLQRDLMDSRKLKFIREQP